MANTYYDSQLTAAEIEEVLEAINGILTPSNNGKVLAISNGKLEARSVQWGGGTPVVQPLSVTQNGTYNPPSGVDGYAPVTVNVSGGGSTVSVEYQNYTGSYVATNKITIGNTQYSDYKSISIDLQEYEGLIIIIDNSNNTRSIFGIVDSPTDNAGLKMLGSNYYLVYNTEGKVVFSADVALKIGRYCWFDYTSNNGPLPTVTGINLV
jgi:hypothetical protein